jgi:Mn-dependent DtxR family transcriptional regulator
MNPTKEEFKNLRKTMSNKDLALLLKVSMPTVYKIAKELVCEKKKLGARPKVILKD